MKASPIQLIHLSFLKTLVELDPRTSPDFTRSSPLGIFDFEGVSLGTNIGVEELTELPPSMTGHAFHISFELTVDNEPREGVEHPVLSPYLIDLRAVGLVRIPPGAERLGLPRDIAAVNGAGLLWSAFREHLASLTARMPCGEVMLPTVHFHDLKTQQAEPSKPAISAQPKTRARKKS